MQASKMNTPSAKKLRITKTFAQSSVAHFAVNFKRLSNGTCETAFGR
jgi:hypothetical protein